MKRALQVALVLALVGPLAQASAIVVDSVDLDLGRTEENRISAPLFETDGVGSISFEPIASRVDTGDYVAYRLTNKFLKDRSARKKPHFKLDPSIDLGALLTKALREEGSAMGFEVAPEGGAWRVSGTLHDLDLQLHASGGGFGPTLFYGYADLELAVRKGTGEPVSRRFQTFTFTHLYNAGFGAQDEVKEALAGLLVESAQEAISRLNRDLFHAPPDPRVAYRLESIRPGGDDQELDFLLVGLGGTDEAVPRLLRLLDAEDNEGDRVDILNALAIIGSDDAFEPLSSRYADEDEDCRLFILKAMAYLDTERSRELIRQHGTRDRDLACRMWAQRALDRPSESSGSDGP
jgi:hypothetical protein